MNNDTVKRAVKDILGKLPVFIFCVLFISCHNKIFGIDNSITGVIVLIGIIMFLQGDLGFCVKQATCSIPMLFLVIAIMPKLSLINPVWGILINFVSIAFILIVSSHNLSMSNHVPFILGYLFCQGYELSGKANMARILSLMTGSLLIALIYYLINRQKEHRRTFLDLFRELNLHSIRTKWYLKLTLALTIVMFVGTYFNYPRTMWISLAVLSIITPFEQEHISRRNVRVTATILGTVIFFVLFEVLIPVQYQSIVVLCAGFLSMFITDYFKKTVYNAFSALGTAVLLFTAKEAILLRIVSNVIGVAFATIYYKVFDHVFDRVRKA